MRTKKEKKITIKPYLNKKVAAKRKLINLETGTVSDINLYPLYYQIIYNRTNTHVKSYFEDSYYEQIDENHISGVNVQEKIDFEVRVINRIIRYKEKGETNYKIKGISQIYPEYSQSLHNLLNLETKKYLCQVFPKQFNNTMYKGLFNCKNEKISFKFLLDTMNKIAGIEPVLNTSELEHFKNIWLFNKIYKLKHVTFLIGHRSEEAYYWYVPNENKEIYDTQRNEIGFTKNNFEFPTYIDWVSGYTKEEIKQICAENIEFQDIDINRVFESINWILKIPEEEL